MTDSLKKALNSRFFFYLNPFFVFIFTFLFIFNFIDHSEFLIFQSRDLYRTFEFIKGNFIIHGPEMTNGGHLSGPTIYLLHSIPLYFFNSWKAVLIWAALLCGLGTSVLWTEIQKQNGTFAAYLYFLIYLSGSLGPYAILYNLHPTYLLFFAPLILCCYFRVFYDSNEKYLYIAFLLIGLSIQIHFSSFIWIIIFVISTIFNRLFGLQKPRPRSILIGIGIMLLLQMPYLLWYFNRNTFGNLGYSGALFNIIYIWFDFGNIFEKLDQTKPPWTSVMYAYFHQNLQMIFWICQLLGLAALKYFFKKSIQVKRSTIFFLLISAILLFASVLSEVKYTPRYVFITNLLFSVSIAITVKEALGNHRLGKLFNISIALIFIFYFVYERNSSWQKFDQQAINSAKSITIDCQTARHFANQHITARTLVQLSDLVIKLTGKNYEEFQKSTYIAGGLTFDANFGFKPIYDDRFVSHKGSQILDSTPKGFILIKLDSLPCYGKNTSFEGSTAPFTISEHLPFTLRKYFEAGHIFTNDIYAYGGVALLPYYSQKEMLDVQVQNFGHAYEEILGLEKPQPKTSNDKDKIFFDWNDCPGTPDFCNIQAKLVISNSKFDVRGDVISVREVSYSPTMIISYESISIEITCKKKKFPQLIPLIKEGLGSSMYSRNFVLAPFSDLVALPCKGKDIEKLSLNIGPGYIFEASRFVKRQIPPRRLTWVP